MKEEGADVHISKSLDVYTDKTLMNSIDLVVQIFTMSQISKEQEAGLLEAIRVNGTGIAGWHGGLCDAFRNNTEYQYMTCGHWVSHPSGVIDYRVNIIDKNDNGFQWASASKLMPRKNGYHLYTSDNLIPL